MQMIGFSISSLFVCVYILTVNDMMRHLTVLFMLLYLFKIPILKSQDAISGINHLHNTDLAYIY